MICLSPHIFIKQVIHKKNMLLIFFKKPNEICVNKIIKFFLPSFRHQLSKQISNINLKSDLQVYIQV